MKETDGLGVHAVCADGSFPVIGNELQKENFCLELYLCQCYVALSILHKNGVFVCKFFDTYTRFSVGLLYLLSLCFKEISIYKPITSRPGTSEKYFVGKSLCSRKKVYPILMHLYKIIKNKACTSFYNIDLLPWHVIVEDDIFFNYIKNRTFEIEQIQIETINNILIQLKRISSPNFNTISIDNLCSFWNIQYFSKPNQSLANNQHNNNHHHQQSFKHPIQIFNQLFEYHHLDGNILLQRLIPTQKDREWLQIHRSENSKWYFVKLCKSNENIKCVIYSCLIDSIVHTYNSDCKWIFNNLIINLPVRTVVLGAMYKNTLFILDAAMLGGRNITHLPFEARLMKIKIFIKTISNISDGHMYKNSVRISSVDYIQENFSQQLNETSPNDSSIQNKGLYLAINDNIFVSKCLFYK